jgi:signal transduction histidine kinase
MNRLAVLVSAGRERFAWLCPISRTIVERHGGKVWAANNPDRGATFSITLPVSARESDR